jgi:hypothetical protein
MLLAALSCLIPAQVQSPALVKVFTFRSGYGEMRKRVVIGTQQGGIYGLEPDTKRKTFDLPPLVNQPVTAVEEGYDGHYVWAVAGSSDVYHLRNGTTESISTGLTTPVMRLDNWGDLLVVQGQNEARFLDIRGNRNFAPTDVFPRNRHPELDIPTAISQGPCLFSWDRGLGTVISVARMGQLQTPKEENGTLDLSYVRAWRMNARRQVQFLGGYFAPLAPFGDSNGFNEVKIGSRTYSGPVGLSRLSNFAITKEGVVAVTKSQIRALPFQKKNWDVDDPIQLPVAANYPSSVSGSGNSVWYADCKRIFQYTVDSGSLSVFIRKKAGDIRSVAGDETGVWVVTDTSVDRLSPSDPGSVRELGYLQLEVQGEGPLFGKDRRQLKKVLESPFPAPTDDPVWAAIRRTGIKPSANLQPLPLAT